MLRKILIGAAATLLAPAAAFAQDAPAVEVFGGYAHTRSGGEGLNGWDAAVAYNFNDWFGVKANVSGGYGSETVEFPGSGPEFPVPATPSFIADTDVSQHNFLFGPQFTARGDRVSGFVHTLVGASRESVDGTTFFAPVPGFPDQPPLVFEFTDTNFAADVGAGVDLKVTDSVSWRVLQADWIPVSRFANEWQHNVRFSTGIVLTFE